MMLRFMFRNFLVLILSGLFTFSVAKPLSQDPAIAAFIQEEVKRDHFNKRQLERLFNQVKIQQAIIDRISHPYEAKPWHEYRDLFVNEKRINNGVRFWHKYQKPIQQASKQYGVSESMIVAIIGIESLYGEKQGEFRVIDALSTLAFRYPPRAKFFKSELRQLLLLSREYHVSPLKFKGSYAGAIGQPQFIPSSYRNYAVNFSGGHYPDLSHNTVDVIGSVANYFSKHGWKIDQPSAVPGVKSSFLSNRLINQPRTLTTRYDLKTLSRHGIKPTEPIPDLPVNVVKLQGKNKDEYWITMPNFYVITRYNTSEVYALAAVLLAKELENKYNPKLAAR